MFHQLSTGEKGWGPLLNKRSCSSCHVKDGRGEPPSFGEAPDGFLIRVSLTGKDFKGAPKPHPIYGNQISVRALPKAKPEARVTIEYGHINGTDLASLGFAKEHPQLKNMDH